MANKDLNEEITFAMTVEEYDFLKNRQEGSLIELVDNQMGEVPGKTCRVRCNNNDHSTIMDVLLDNGF